MIDKSRSFSNSPAAAAAMKEIAALAYRWSINCHLEETEDSGRRFVFEFEDEPRRKFVLGAAPSKRVAFLESVRLITEKHDPA